MVYSLLGTIIAFFSLTIIRDKDAFSNCSAKIKALSIAFSALILNPARAVDRYFAVLSVSAKSLIWRNIYYFNF
jgi:hypothetical protein